MVPLSNLHAHRSTSGGAGERIPMGEEDVSCVAGLEAKGSGCCRIKSRRGAAGCVAELACRDAYLSPPFHSQAKVHHAIAEGVERDGKCRSRAAAGKLCVDNSFDRSRPRPQARKTPLHLESTEKHRRMPRRTSLPRWSRSETSIHRPIRSMSTPP